MTAPQVTGEAQVGQTLTAAVGSWTGSPTAFAFQWSRCDTGGAACTPLPGATASTYVLTPGDIGTTLSLVVTATGRGGSRTAGAPTTAVIAPAPVPAAVPGPLAAQAGVAGAVVTTDGRATVTWQPGAVPVRDVGVSRRRGDRPCDRRAAGSRSPSRRGSPRCRGPSTLRTPPRRPDRSRHSPRDGKIWSAITTVTSPSLQGTLLQGTTTPAACCTC